MKDKLTELLRKFNLKKREPAILMSEIQNNEVELKTTSVTYNKSILHNERIRDKAFALAREIAATTK